MTDLLLIQLEASFPVFDVVDGWLPNAVSFALVAIAGFTTASLDLCPFAVLPSMSACSWGEVVFGVDAGTLCTWLLSWLCCFPS